MTKFVNTAENKVNVLISLDLPAELLEKIKSVSPRVEVHQTTDENDLLKLAENTQILFAGKFSREMFLTAKKLKWIQTHLVGVDRFLFPEIVKSEVIMTNAQGVNSTAVAEHVLGLMFCLNRKLHLFIRNQIGKKWKTSDDDLLPKLDELSGKTLGVVGLGTIGLEIAKRAKCLGMKVVGSRRSVKAQKPDFVDELVSAQKLGDLFSESDFVAVQLPLTEETRGLIGEEELRDMKNNAFLINASRGEIIEERSLVRALQEGWIAGAGLDAFASEPLPKDSPLWGMENVVLTPHVAGLAPEYMNRLVKIFCENLERFLNNEKMTNVIDKVRGY